MINLYFHSAFLFISVALGCAAHADTITLSVKTNTSDGTVRAAVFESQKSFDADAPTTFAVAQAMAGVTVLKIPKLKSGTYGIALFHDQNDDEKLNTNLLGAPNEPFGFSNNPKIGFSAPGFDSFKFEHGGTAQTFNITLNGG